MITSIKDAFKYIVGLKNEVAPYDEIDKMLTTLMSINEYECMCFIFTVRAMSRKNMSYKDRNGISVVGLNRRHDGINMMYWLMCNRPDLFYKNLELFCTLYGRWKDIIDIWEIDINRNVLLENTVINRDFVCNLLLKAILDPRHGVEASRAIPTIRRISEARTRHRMATNLIGKCIRGKMPKNNEKNQHSFYRSIKSAYRNVPVTYDFIQLNFAGMKIDDLYNSLIRQKTNKLIKCNKGHENKNNKTGKQRTDRNV